MSKEIAVICTEPIGPTSRNMTSSRAIDLH
jgi:hypothetical protein